MEKRELVIILGVVILVLFFNIKASQAQEDELKSISTTIINMEWKIDDITSNQPRTYFRFFFDYVIYNPNKEAVTLRLGYQVEFFPDFTCILENESIRWYYAPSGRSAYYATIHPGYHFENSSELILIFHADNLIHLPDGFYKFWIRCYPESPTIIYNEETIAIKYGQTLSNYLSITMNLLSLFAIASLLVILHKIK